MFFLPVTVLRVEKGRGISFDKFLCLFANRTLNDSLSVFQLVDEKLRFGTESYFYDQVLCALQMEDERKKKAALLAKMKDLEEEKPVSSSTPQKSDGADLRKLLETDSKTVHKPFGRLDKVDKPPKVSKMSRIFCQKFSTSFVNFSSNRKSSILRPAEAPRKLLVSLKIF